MSRLPLRPEEEWAKLIIEAHLRVPLMGHDDGSAQGMYDLAISYSGHRLGAVEVTAAADSETTEFWNLANGSGGRWQAQEIKGGWAVECERTARVRRLRRDLPRLLASFEAQGVSSFGRHPWSGGNPFAGFARELGIKRAFQGGTDFPGSIYLTVELPPERSGGMVAESGDAAAEWIGQFLRESRQADVLDKLNLSGADERHAFVILPGFTTAPFSVSDLLWRQDAPLPTQDPSLPPEVTHAWMVSTWSAGVGFYWSPANGWQSVSKQVFADRQ